MNIQKEILRMESQGITPEEIELDAECLSAIKQGRVELDGNVISFKKAWMESVNLMIPKDFRLMEKEMIQIKYPYTQRADYIFTNPEGDKDLSFQILQDSVSYEDFKPFAYALFNTFRQSSKIEEVLHEAFWQEEDKQALMFGFNKPTLGAPVYMYLSINDTNGILSLLSTCAPEEEQKMWSVISEGITKTITEAEENT